MEKLRVCEFPTNCNIQTQQFSKHFDVSLGLSKSNIENRPPIILRFLEKILATFCEGIS